MQYCFLKVSIFCSLVASCKVQLFSVRETLKGLKKLICLSNHSRLGRKNEIKILNVTVPFLFRDLREKKQLFHFRNKSVNTNFELEVLQKLLIISGAWV